MDYRGARFYDADVARFLSLEPAAREYPSLSDYCYVAGNPVMYLDPTGKHISPYQGSGYHQKTYNSIVKNLQSKNSMFSKVYSQVDASKEHFQVKLSVLHPTLNGQFQPANDIKGSRLEFPRTRLIPNVNEVSYIKDKPGSSSNPHTIALNERSGSNKGVPKGFKATTIFEEFFHAGQHLHSKNNQLSLSGLEKETEAKVAKAYSHHQGELSLDANIHEWYKDNKTVKNYFDALKNGTEISETLEKNY